jgi:hypothetical protein
MLPNEKTTQLPTPTELKSAIKNSEFDLPVSAIDYSEHGMQGKNYVSFDVGNRFMRAWRRAELPILDEEPFYAGLAPGRTSDRR